MERTEIFELMAALKLYGMRAAGACPRAGEAGLHMIIESGQL